MKEKQTGHKIQSEPNNAYTDERLTPKGNIYTKNSPMKTCAYGTRPFTAT